MNYTQADVDYAIRLAEATFRRFWEKTRRRDYLDEEGLQAAAYFGAARALNTFRPDGASQFRSWVISAVEYAMMEESRGWHFLAEFPRQRIQKEVSRGGDIPEYAKSPLLLSGPIPGADDAETFEDFLADEAIHVEQDVVQSCEREWIWKCLERLSRHDYQILSLYYREGKPDKEIGQELGLKRSTVTHHRRRAERAAAAILRREGFA